MTAGRERPVVVAAEDDPLLIRLLRATFRDSPWELVVAVTGPQTLEVVGTIVPALVLLDVGLPELDGFEVCRRIKADPETAGVTVLMLTARTSRADQLKAEQTGADGFLTKPFSPSGLLAAVSARLGERGSG